MKLIALGGMFGGHDQVTFIFAVFIIYDHHLAAPNIGDHGFHRIKGDLLAAFFSFSSLDFLAGMLTG